MKNTKIEKILGINFLNKELLREALTHESYANENRTRDPQTPNNERLEFLGDSVLAVVVSSILYDKAPEMSEGDMTSIKGILVSGKTFVEIAKSLHLEDYLLVSKNQFKGAQVKQKILGDAFEAIVGAIFLDLGYEEAKSFALKHIAPLAEKVISEGDWINAKTKLQEKTQSALGVLPTYKVLNEASMANGMTYTVGVFIKGELLAEGVGATKKSAEKSAAKSVLETKKW